MGRRVSMRYSHEPVILGRQGAEQAVLVAGEK